MGDIVLEVGPLHSVLRDFDGSCSASKSVYLLCVCLMKVRMCILNVCECACADLGEHIGILCTLSFYI